MKRVDNRFSYCYNFSLIYYIFILYFRQKYIFLFKSLSLNFNFVTNFFYVNFVPKANVENADVDFSNFTIVTLEM